MQEKKVAMRILDGAEIDMVCGGNNGNTLPGFGTVTPSRTFNYSNTNNGSFPGYEGTTKGSDQSGRNVGNGRDTP